MVAFYLQPIFYVIKYYKQGKIKKDKTWKKDRLI